MILILTLPKESLMGWCFTNKCLIADISKILKALDSAAPHEVMSSLKTFKGGGWSDSDSALQLLDSPQGPHCLCEAIVTFIMYIFAVYV